MCNHEMCPHTVVMTWCIYYLATHPDIQEEIVEVLGDMDPSPQVASEFKYVKTMLMLL